MATLPQAILPPDVVASRPAAGSPGRLFYATDTQLLYRDNGTTWDTLTMSGGTSADHDHTGAGAGGVLTNDKHDGYLEVGQVGSIPSPAGGSNAVRIGALDKAGISTLYYKDEAGTLYELPTIVSGGGGGGSGAPADAHYVTTQAESGLSAESTLAAIIGRGATGSRPSAGTAGRLYYDTTLGELQRDNGSTWDSVESTAASGAPTTAHYVTTQAESGLSAEVLLSAVIGRGVTGSRPSAGTAGRLYFDTTLSKMQRDNGSTWDDVAEVGGLSQVSTLNFVIDGGGSTITTGIKGDIVVDFACTVTGWVLLADQIGSIVVDIWKDTYANYPPVAGDSITAAAKPTISGATKGQFSTLSGWTTSITAGDVLRFNVDSVTTVQRVTVAVAVQR